MKYITKVEFNNYKAFYGIDKKNELDIPFGKNVLIYGENGSGKSSIYEGLKQFFESSDRSNPVEILRNVRVPETSPDENGDDIVNDVSVDVTFQATNENGENQIDRVGFGVNHTDTHTYDFVRNANQLNSFFSYRELLKTYLMDDLRDGYEFRTKLARLIVEGLLNKTINSSTNNTYFTDWENMFKPRKWYKEELLQKFLIGLSRDVNRINLVLNDIIGKFDESIEISIIIDVAYLEYGHTTKGGKTMLYPELEIDLKIKYNGFEFTNKGQSHLEVLNEARLSAIALSFYLSSLVVTPQDKMDYKILFFDDVFIGLDLGNRLPLLEIINNYKKPIIIMKVDEDGEIVERLSFIDDTIEREKNSFFDNYQVFISTYDRYWYSIAKSYFQTNTNDKWHFVEMYANIAGENNFHTPIIYNSLDDLQKAKFLLKIHDYPSCANHIRKAIESRVKKLLPSNLHYCEVIDNDTGLKEIRKLRSLSQYLDVFISFCNENNFSVSELIELKNLKDWYFNPFSHDNISTPIYRKELERAFNLAQKLEKFNFPIIAEAGLKLYFNFDAGNGETRQYKIKVKENIRSISTNGIIILSNPKISCYEWTKNGITEEVNWDDSSLFHFYNNKLKSLLKLADKVDIPIVEFWDKLFLLDNDQPIKSLLNQ